MPPKPTKTKAVEQFFIGEEPPNKRRLIEIASKLAKSIAEKMKDNKTPKPPKQQSVPNNEVKNVHLTPDSKSKKVQMQNIEP